MRTPARPFTLTPSNQASAIRKTSGERGEKRSCVRSTLEKVARLGQDRLRTSPAQLISCVHLAEDAALPNIYDNMDKHLIDALRDRLRSEIEAALSQQTTVNRLFTIRWRLTA